MLGQRMEGKHEFYKDRLPKMVKLVIKAKIVDILMLMKSFT